MANQSEPRAAHSATTMSVGDPAGDGKVTMTTMMKEIQGLKDKFKSDEDEAC